MPLADCLTKAGYTDTEKNAIQNSIDKIIERDKIGEKEAIDMLEGELKSNLFQIFKQTDIFPKVEKNTPNLQALAGRTEKEVNRVASLPKENEGGSTFNLDGTKYEGGGLLVPVVSENLPTSELTPQRIANFVRQNKGKIGGENVKVGIYKFPNQDQASIDLNIIAPNENRENVLEFGKRAGQESLFDVGTGENIKTGSSGQNPLSFTDEQFQQIAKDLSEGKIPDVFPPPTQSEIEKSMAADAEKLTTSFNKVVANKASTLRGGELNRFQSSIDNSKFAQAVDEVFGTNPKTLAKSIGEVVENLKRVPKAIKAELEAEMGESLADFRNRIRNLNNQRLELARNQAAFAREKKGTNKSTNYAGSSKVSEPGSVGTSLGLTTEDINELREYVDLEATKTSTKSVDDVIKEAEGKYISPDSELFTREKFIVHEVLDGHVIMQADSKMIALRYGIDKLTKSQKLLEELLPKAKTPFDRLDLNRKIQNIREDIHFMTLAYNKIGTIGGRILRFRQEFLESKLYTKDSLSNMMMEAKNGETLTESEKKFVDKTSKSLSKLRAEIDTLLTSNALKHDEAMAVVSKRQWNKLSKEGRSRKRSLRPRKSVEVAKQELLDFLKKGC